MGLRDDARAAARPVHPPADRPVTDATDPDNRFTEPPVGAAPTDGDPADSGVYRNTEPYPTVLPDIDYTESGLPVTPPDTPVQLAWAAVMAEVQQVSKLSTFSAPGAGNYNFRGIDATVNAVGPALRKHRVMVIPTRVVPTYGKATVGRNNTTMREVTVVVDYQIWGPRGDFMPAQSAGECLDSGDKGTTKACTVAYRNLLLTGLSIPTRNPHLDPDQTNYQRSAPERQPTALPSINDLRDEAVRKDTSRDRLIQMYYMVTKDHPRMGQEPVTNESGDVESLAEMITRLGQARPAGGAS